MRKAMFVIAITSVVLTGCMGNNWYKPGVSEYQSQVDLSQCRMYANSGAPIQMPNLQATSQYHQGTVYTRSGSFMYEGTSTTMPQADMSGLMSGIRYRSLYENCMRAKGYQQESMFSSKRADPESRTQVKCKMPSGEVVEVSRSRCSSNHGIVFK